MAISNDIRFADTSARKMKFLLRLRTARPSRSWNGSTTRRPPFTIRSSIASWPILRPTSTPSFTCSRGVSAPVSSRCRLHSRTPVYYSGYSPLSSSARPAHTAFTYSSSALTICAGGRRHRVSDSPTSPRPLFSSGPNQFRNTPG